MQAAKKAVGTEKFVLTVTVGTKKAVSIGVSIVTTRRHRYNFFAL
jgi:hypothetical protein